VQQHLVEIRTIFWPLDCLHSLAEGLQLDLVDKVEESTHPYTANTLEDGMRVSEFLILSLAGECKVNLYRFLPGIKNRHERGNQRG
jgi:hypothetical protein